MNAPVRITPIKITRVGNSAGLILSKELLARLGVDVGDKLTVETTESGIMLRPYEADFEAQMALAREVMARRRRALRELAK